MPTTAQQPFDLDRLEAPRYLPFLVYRDLPHWELLVDLGPELAISKGHRLTFSSETAHCYLVRSGMIESLVRDRGHFVNHSAFFMEGGLFQEPSALSGLPSIVSYKAVSDATVTRIEHEALREAMAADRRIFDLVLRSITIKLNASHEQQRQTYLLDIRARIYFMLLGIAATAGFDEGDGWHRLEIKITQQQMSDMLGVNRVTVNTALQELYEAKVVRKRDGRYGVFDGRDFLSSCIACPTQEL